MEQNNQSGTNTVLIVIILIILVGLGVWWFSTRGAPAGTNNGGSLNVDVTVPEGSGGGGIAE